MRLTFVCGFVFVIFSNTPASCQKAESQIFGVQGIGEQVGTCYHRALAEVDEILKKETDPKTIESGLEAIKDKAVTELVKLGHMRESLSEKEKEDLDAVIMQAMRLVDMDHWNALNDATNSFQADHFEIAEILFEINIITQYADFELLRAQSPEEAKRLGVSEKD